MATTQNDRSLRLYATVPRSTVAQAPGSSIYPTLADVGWSTPLIGGSAIVAVTDGPSGATARRSTTGQQTYLQHNTLFTIDRSRTYRVRFYARASATANGGLYFSLRQYLADGVTTGPANSGREPYKPLGRPAADTRSWMALDYTWSIPDWQAGVTQVRPEFLMNYIDGNVVPSGYWEIQDFQMQDMTEVLAAKAAADQAAQDVLTINNTIAGFVADGILDRSEKPIQFQIWSTIYNERAGIVARAGALSVSSTAYSAAYTALETYLTSLSPGLGDYSANTTIDRAIFTARFNDYGVAKQALQNSIYAKVATTADWTSGIANRPPDSALLNSAIRLGSRNYFPNSQYFTEYPNDTGLGTQSLRNDEVIPYYRIAATGGVSTYGAVYAFPKIPVGTVCTISADVRTVASAQVGFYGGVGLQTVPGNKWTRIYFTFTYDPASRATSPVGFSASTTNQLDVRNYKVEIGNIGSDWSPAPEDVEASITAERTRIDNISADNVLSRNEKIGVIRDWAEISNEVSSLTAQAAALGVSSSALVAAKNALGSYLGAITGGWNNTTVDSSVLRTEFNTAFNTYYINRVDIINALAAKAATTSSVLFTLDVAAGSGLFGARDRVDPPAEYPVGTTRQFKQASTFGFTTASGYFALETFKQYIDATGGGAVQYAYTDSKTYRRWTGSANGSNASWSAWTQDLDRNAYTGDLDASRGAPIGTNVGSTPAEVIEGKAINAIPVPTGFVLNGTFGDLVTSSSTQPVNLVAYLSASASGATGTVTYSWTMSALDTSSMGNSKLSSASSPSVTITMNLANNSLRLSVTCTATDNTTGVSRVKGGIVEFRAGNY